MSQPRPKLDDLRIERPAASGAPNRALPWVIIVLALLVISGIAYWWLGRTRAIPVRTAVARAVSSAGTDRTVLNASGYVVARREATVSSKIMGKVTEILVEEGLKVQANQVLARLDDTNVQASLRLAQAQAKAAEAALQETRVRLKEAELDLSRQTALRSSNVAAQADFDRAEAAANALRARLAQQQIEVTVAERSVAVIQQQLDDATIRSPFAGIVTSKNAQPGEMISPMSSGGFTRTGICTIVDMESLEIEIDVNESYINRVAPGQAVEATLDAYPEWKIPCKVIAIIPTADRAKSTVRVRVGFDQLDPRILPQMAVKVAFRESATAPTSAAPSRSVIVPKGAVASRDGRDVVFLVQNGRVERRAVTVAGTVGADTTLSAGLGTGDRVVVDPTAEIADGVRVEEKKL
ncbi:MAG: efflux RND transporter periplasmic adaptor subunit [Verrucomicrobia bacterium]|nr:efflux RND transporter periplasmic adaptor subunit [Verrucomicrobiota bacterium]